MTNTTRDNSMTEIGEPRRRRVLVPDETPAPTPIVKPVKPPEREQNASPHEFPRSQGWGQAFSLSSHNRHHPPMRCPARSATDESKYRPHPQLSVLWDEWLIISSHTVEKSLFFARRVALGSSVIQFIVNMVRCGLVVERRPRWRVRPGLSGRGRS